MNNVPLNASSPDVLVNILEYVQIDKNENVTTFASVTCSELTEGNV